jgi:integrase
MVAFPPHIGEAIKAQLETHAQWGRDGLLFPTTRGGQYRAPTFHSAHFRKAREAAGRPDLRFHDLRHTGATLAAASGATLAPILVRAASEVDEGSALLPWTLSPEGAVNSC